MRHLLILITILLISNDLAFAQCGVRRQIQTETRQKSSLTIPEGTENVKKLATVSKKEAKKAAVEKYPGKAKKVELITDEGTLVWKVEVKGEQGLKELFIDPANGSFLGYGLTK